MQSFTKTHVTNYGSVVITAPCCLWHLSSPRLSTTCELPNEKLKPDIRTMQVFLNLHTTNYWWGTQACIFFFVSACQWVLLAAHSCVSDTPTTAYSNYMLILSFGCVYDLLGVTGLFCSISGGNLLAYRLRWWWNWWTPLCVSPGLSWREETNSCFVGRQFFSNAFPLCLHYLC